MSAPKIVQQEIADLEFYRSVNRCPSIEILDQDAIEMCGNLIYVHEDGLASRIKGRILLTHWQRQQLVRQLLELDDIEDWTCVDLTAFVER